MRKRLAAALLVATLAGTLPSPTAAQTVPAVPLPEGTLVRTVSDAKVYYLQSGSRRWIDSEAAFLAQGFRWTDVTVIGDRELFDYAPGADITPSTPGGLVSRRDLLPDLAPFAPDEFRYSVSGGRTRLRFTASFWNQGKGAFELNTLQQPSSGDGEFEADQRVFTAGGGTWDRRVGNIFWHGIHEHYHYADFGDYTLEMIRPAVAGTTVPAAVTLKTTFCMRDDATVSAPTQGPKQSFTYNGCDDHRQGVSVGWADVYPWTLEDQFIDVTGLPAGLYKLAFRVDPKGYFLESRRDNNVGIALLDLDPANRTFRVVASGSAFTASTNRFPDGTLLKTDDDPKVFAVRNGRKRHLLNEDVFRSYGYSFANVITVPSGVLSAIPFDKLVRAQGTPQVWLLNDAGYRRRLLDPGVMASYGWDGDDIAEVNATELASYPQTDIIRLVTGDEIYSLNAKRQVAIVGTLVAKGLDPASVHVVNKTDFDAYAVSVAATGLAVPWDIAFLPDGDMLVTERPGTLRRLGANPAAIDVPEVLHTGEGGLMGMALHPDFASNRLVYLYFTTSENGQRNRIARFRLDGDRLVEDKVIMEDIPAAIYHDGGQIAFGPDGMLYVTTGDANSPDLAQDLGSFAGKTLRVTPEGGIPSDNPFGSAIWSYGHRNAQGVAWDAEGRQWQTEHGRSGALSGYDELNLISKGGNYGWPANQGNLVTTGTIGPARHSGADVTWAPSGMAYVSGALYFAGLRGETLYRATPASDGAIVKFESLLAKKYGRLRAVVVGPDGMLYVSTSNRDGRGTPRTGDDRILRIAPDFLK